VGTRRGKVRDSIAARQREWLDLLEALARAAQEAGELPADVDAAQLAFEVNAILVAANTSFMLQEDPAALKRAREAIAERLPRS
jgi:hypothetical protein